MARIPQSHTFISYFAELDKCKNVEAVKGIDLWKLRQNYPKVPSWSLFSLERGRVIRDMKMFNQDIESRVHEILKSATNGFDDILSAIKDQKHDILFNAEILKDLIDNVDLTYGEKRKRIVDTFMAAFSDIKDDPAIKSRYDAISPQRREELLAIKEAFKKAPHPEDKIRALKAIEIRPNTFAASNYLDLCLVSADDPEFIYAALFKIPPDTPPHPIREAFLSLFFQGDHEKYEEPASFKPLERSIKTFDYDSIPKKLKEWNHEIEKNNNAALITLTPALKDLSKRLVKHTNVPLGTYFKAVFSSDARREIAKLGELAKTIPEIEKIRKSLKARAQNKAHLKNVKRNCLEIENNQNLPRLRLEYRKALKKDIPVKTLDKILDGLHQGSIADYLELVLHNGIEKDEALLKLLAIRLSHFPTLAAILSTNRSNQSDEVSRFIYRLNVARSEVLRTLKFYG